VEPKPWNRLREDRLLEKKISDLKLDLRGTHIEVLIDRLYQELDQKGLALKPRCFIADEWFVPVGIPAIGIPFYLLHSRLRKLEQKFILEIEGGTKTEFLKLIRHETGHAYSYAYQLFRKNKWRRLFGSASTRYPEPDTYRPRPHSHLFVTHLDNWYAQSHPDEDFAETFAVWLTPGQNWKKRYRGWKALEKLEYVDALMKSIAGQPPKHVPRFRQSEHSSLNQKLKTYYHKKRKQYEESYPDFYDNDLKTLFTDQEAERSDVKAVQYLRVTHQKILKSVALWTKEKKYTIDQLMRDLTSRTKELNLHVRRGDTDLDTNVTAFITALVTNHLFTGKFKRSR
jgi:hypothetical protein